MLQLTFEYMPYHYDDDLQLILNDFSDPDNLRFVIEQDYMSAFSIFTNPDDESSSFESSFLEQWFHRLQAFPLFVCVEVNRYDEEEFEALCRFCSITYNDLTPLADKHFIVVELQHVTDFQHLYSYLHSHVSWNDLVIWSTKPNVFRIEYRTHYYSGRPEKTVIVSMQENMSIFAFSYDADVVNVVSNQPFFETADRLFQTLPDFVIPTLVDDTEDIQKKGVNGLHALTKQLTEYMLEKYRLTNYILHESYYDRHKLNDQTVYSFETFWIPSGTSIIEEEDGVMLPKGTVQITIEPVTKRTTTLSLHGPTYLHSVPDDLRDPTTRIAWLESETDMIHGTHFMLEEENDTFFSYVSCHEGIRLSPGCFIHLTLTENGQLDELFLYGPHPLDHRVNQEPFTLTLEDIDSLAKQQIKWFSYTKPGHQYAHTVVETIVTQEGSSLVPSKLDFTSSIEVNDVLSWTGLPSKMHERYPYQSGETVTANDVITQTEHPDFRPIQQETVNACRIVIKDIIQSEYPADSGQWMIRHIYRQHPYLAVTLSRAHPTSYVDQHRRVTIFLDEKTLHWISLTDDQELHTVFDSVSAPELEDEQQDIIFNALRPYLLLTPRYVFAASKGQYVLCGLLDSNHAYLPATNEVVLLRNL